MLPSGEMMYGLPPSTEVNRPLPKKVIIEKFGLFGKEKSIFDSNIHRITIVNEISPNTVNLQSKEIRGIFIIRVEINSENYDREIIKSLFKLIPQKIVMVLECGPRCRPVINQNVLIEGHWRLSDEMMFTLKGLNLDSVWENLIIHIGSIIIDNENGLTSQIAINYERKKRDEEIAMLQKRMASEKQPRKKKELFDKIKQLMIK